MLILLLSCRTTGFWGPPEASLQRMVVQPRVDPYEDPRNPPAGAIPWAPDRAEPAPVPLDRELLTRGRARFEVFCAPCHGVDGAARTPVAQAMPLPPRDLRSDYLRAEPDRIRAAIRGGYGLMPPYADRVSGRDEDAVVGWVRVLQHVELPVTELPPDLRARVPPETP